MRQTYIIYFYLAYNFSIILGEYTMEYCRYSPASPETHEAVVKQFRNSLEKNDAKGKKKKN